MRHRSSVILPVSIWCLLITVQAKRSMTFGVRGCLQNCTCSSTQEVDCRNQSFYSFPSGISLSTNQLYLNLNLIQKLEQDSLKSLSNLTVLNLARNRINIIETRAFSNLKNLQRLDLSNNKLTQVPQQAFGYLKKLKNLNLSNNPIIRMTRLQFFQLQDSLLILDLNNLRHLNSVSNYAFRGLFNLQVLQIDFCNLWKIPSLQTLSNLTSLSLSSNTFQMIGSKTFLGASQLTNLTLSSCKIKRIQNDAFSNLVLLKHLDLSNNNLVAVNPVVFYHNTKLLFLNFYANPWLCDCDLLPLVNYLLKHNFCSDEICPVCHSPEAYEGEILKKIRSVDPPLTCAAAFTRAALNEFPSSVAAKGVKEPCSKGKTKNSFGNAFPRESIKHGKYTVRLQPLGNANLNFTKVFLQDKGLDECNDSISENAQNSYDENKSGTNSNNAVKIKTDNSTQFSNEGSNGKYQNPDKDAPNSKGENNKGLATNNIEEVTKTTNVIIGCFVGLTMLAAILLIILYKTRKRARSADEVNGRYSFNDESVEIASKDELDNQRLNEISTLAANRQNHPGSKSWVSSVSQNLDRESCSSYASPSAAALPTKVENAGEDGRGALKANYKDLCQNYRTSGILRIDSMELFPTAPIDLLNRFKRHTISYSKYPMRESPNHDDTSSCQEVYFQRPIAREKCNSQSTVCNPIPLLSGPEIKQFHQQTSLPNGTSTCLKSKKNSIYKNQTGARKSKSVHINPSIKVQSLHNNHNEHRETEI